MIKHIQVTQRSIVFYAQCLSSITAGEKRSYSARSEINVDKQCI